MASRRSPPAGPSCWRPWRRPATTGRARPARLLPWGPAHHHPGLPDARAGRRLHPPSAGLCQGAGRRHPGVAVGLHPGVPPPSAARAAVGRAPAVGAAPAAGPDGLGADWVDTYTRALAQPGALSAALAWYRAATPFSLRAPCVGVPTLYIWGSGDPALGRERPPRPGGGWPAPTGSRSLLAPPLAARAARPGAGSPAAGAPATVEDPTNSGGRAGPLTANAGPSHGPIEFTTSASACPQRGREAAIRQESEPGGDPPKPPGAASPPGPTTARGVKEPTAETMSGNRNRRSRFHRPDAIPRRLPCLE